jgi:N-methylhydantoinase A
MGASGVLQPLDQGAASLVAERAARLAPRAVVVSLLHAYRDDAHEKLLGCALRARMPDVDVVLGSEVLPEIREYERTATASAEAYLRPVVGRYLARLGERLSAA